MTGFRYFMSEFYGRVGIICMFEETMEIFLRVCPFYVDIVYESKPGEGRILQLRNSKSGTGRSPCRFAAPDPFISLYV